ncbi:DeoR family transcriptional regulator [Gluconobacter japonicus]|uniref:DeoR family transcriptional regulator n=1 Tax=Gluconobacter japonicus TaxID=376620 RepID=UPI001E31DFDE|nr:DeoR family transcriptional regulator [Gluconobacter japonicus]
MQSHGRVLAADLATEWHVPVDMVRRDLRELAEAGECRRVYGGALRMQPAAAHIHARMGENIALKKRTGQPYCGSFQSQTGGLH